MKLSEKIRKQREIYASGADMKEVIPKAWITSTTQLEAENEALRECLQSARGYLDPSPIIQGKIDALLKESD